MSCDHYDFEDATAGGANACTACGMSTLAVVHDLRTHIAAERARRVEAEALLRRYLTGARPFTIDRDTNLHFAKYPEDK